MRDLTRRLLWASIDNDDSRDLDQLSVAEALAGGAVRILVAIADVDAVVKKGSAIDEHAQTNTTSVYTAAEIFPMLPEQLSTDLTSLGEGAIASRSSIEMTVGADGTRRRRPTSTARRRATTRSSPTTASPRGSTARRRRRRASRRCPGSTSSSASRTASRRRMKALRHQHGALSLETLEARPCSTATRSPTCAPDATNRAKELIEDFMVAANGVTARFLERKGFPSLRRVLRSPERWARIVALAAELGENLPPSAERDALEGFLTERARGATRRASPISRCRWSSCSGAGEYVLELPGASRPRATSALAVRDYTHSTAPEPPLPRSHHAAPAEGGARRARPPPYGSDELAALAQHCTEQEDNATKVERQVRKSAAALLLASRIGERFDAIVTGASREGDVGPHRRPRRRGQARARRSRGSTSAIASRVELVHTDVERGFIDFARAREQHV